MYLHNFWKLLPSVFTLDFWRVNPKLKKLVDKCGHIGADSIFKAKQWAIKKGYKWDNTWYVDGEKFLMKDGCCICMIQPYSCEFTRELSHYNDTGKITYNKTFLLNHNKTANFFFKNFIMKEGFILFQREVKYFEMNKRIVSEGKDYIDSDDFLTDLYWLSMYNYYDLLDLKANTNYTNKEKKEFVCDFCDFTKINLDDYLSIEESEEKEKNKEDYEWNWTNDPIYTALSKSGIDSVLVINPSRLYGVKITKELAKRMNKKYFSYDEKDVEYFEISDHIKTRYK